MIILLIVLVDEHPPAVVAVSVMSYVPAAYEQCVAGFCKVDVVPSPRSQNQLATAPPETVVASVNVIQVGKHPLVIFGLNEIIGKGNTVTVTIAVAGVAVQPSVIVIV